MKKLTIILAMAVSGLSYSQYTTQWPALSQANSFPAGYVGIGTKSTTTSTNTPLPAFNLHLHGTTDYTPPAGRDGGTPISLGKTTRFGLTNSVTGMTESDGAVIRMSDNHFVLQNQEATGNTTVSASGVDMTFSASTNRIWVGSINSYASYAKLNILSTDNGMMIQSLSSTSGYGLRVKMASTTKNAIEVFNGTGTSSDGVRNFSVNGAGQVFARKYTTTLANIPDYVFQPGYSLMPMSDLRTYIAINRHLPNIPSATEYESTGVDLGEMNRLLLEKTEELTLYILQLEERLRILEEKK